MTFSPGVRLGAYGIVALAGGMGEVYRAHDTKLGRSVAVKVLPEAFAADPERIVRFEREARMLASLYVGSLDTTERTLLLKSDGSNVAFVRDHWVLYNSLESGRGEVYVTSFPKADGKWQVSTDGGQWARWSRDGREIYYLGLDNQLIAAEVDGTGNTFKAGSVRPLFPMPTRTRRFSFDVSADSKRFLVNSIQEQSTTTPVTVVLNWTPPQ